MSVHSHTAKSVFRTARIRIAVALVSILFFGVSIPGLAQIPASQHVVLVIEENQQFTTVQSLMPWLTSMGNQYGYAANYQADTSGSLKDYLWLSSGSCEGPSCAPSSLPPGSGNFGCGGGGCTNPPITDDNIFRILSNAGISWKEYMESYTGWNGPDNSLYVKRHNPAAWYSDVINSATLQNQIVDFSNFATDANANNLPAYSIVVPNLQDDAHDGTPAAADTWLQNNIGPILNTPPFQSGGDGILIITFDECDAAAGGGCSSGQEHVYTAVIGPGVIRGTVSTTFYKHENTLRTILQALGQTDFPLASAAAAPMSDFFNPASESVLLSDNFDTTGLDTSKWSVKVFTGTQDTSIPVSDTGGQLQIGPLLQNTTGSHYNGITSVSQFDFTGAYAYVQLVQPAAPNTGAFTMFAVGKDINNFYRFYVSGTSLVCEKKISGTKTTLATLTYDAVAHQFLRIRHDPPSGDVIFETAPNNGGVPGNWSQQYSEAWDTTDVPLSSIQFEMKAGTSSAEANPPGTVLFDNFKAAKPVLLSDDFSTNGLDTSKWKISVFTGTQDTSIPVSDTGGQLQIGPLLQNTTGSHYNGITSVSQFDFTGAYAYVQLVQPAAPNTGAFTMFAVGKDINNFYRFYVSGTSLVCEKKIGGTKTTLVTVTYDAVAHQFLRIRHDQPSGDVIFETAPNNGGVPGNWSQQYSEAWDTTDVPLSAIQFEMKAGTSGAETNPPGTVIFDNFEAAKL